MAFPITRSAVANVQGTNSTSWTLSYPGAGDILDGGGSAIVSGDLIIVNIGRDGSTGTGTISGFTSLFDQPASGNVARGLTFVKVADGTESGTFTYTPGASEQGAWRVVVVKDWYGQISGGVEVSSAATGASTTPDPPSFSPSWGSADTYWRAIFAADDGRTTISTYPANYNLYQNFDASGGSGGANMGSAGRQNATATEDAGSFTKSGTGSAAGWVAWTIAVRPNAAVTNNGSFTADANIKKIDIPGTFTANANIKIVDKTQQFTADAYISKTTQGTFTADADIILRVEQNFTADAYILTTTADNFSADAYISKTTESSFTADSNISATVVGNFTADAYIQGNAPEQPVWVSPADTATVTATPVLVFTIPSGPAGNYHFHMEIDTAATFDTGNLRSLRSHADQTGWEYDSTGAGGWVAVPQAGVASTFAGNQARYTVQNGLSNGTWYRRVRVGL